MILLDTHNAMDLNFGVKEVIIVCGGVVAVVTNYLILKFGLSALEAKTESDIKEVENASKAENVLLTQRIKTMEREQKLNREGFENLETKIGEKLDGVSKGLSDMAISFANFKLEVQKSISRNGTP